MSLLIPKTQNPSKPINDDAQREGEGGGVM